MEGEEEGYGDMYHEHSLNAPLLQSGSGQGGAGDRQGDVPRHPAIRPSPSLSCFLASHPRWRSGLYFLFTTLQMLCLHFYVTSLSSYRWATAALPAALGLLLGIFLALFRPDNAISPSHLPGRRQQRCSTSPCKGYSEAISKFGTCNTFFISACESLGLVFGLVSFASLPFSTIFLVVSAVPLLSSLPFPTCCQGSLETEGFDSDQRDLEPPQRPAQSIWDRKLLATLLFLAALIVGLCGALSGSVDPSIIMLPRSPKLNGWTAGGGNVATFLAVVGVVAFCACSASGSRCRRNVVAALLHTAVEDEYYAHERERERKEKAKAEGRPVNPTGNKDRPKSKLSSLSLQSGVSSNIVLDVAAFDNCIRILTNALALLASVPLAGVWQSLVGAGLADSNNSVSMAIHSAATLDNIGNNTSVATGSFSWQVQYGIACSFSGGSQVDGSPMLVDTLPTSSATPVNFCPLVLPTGLGLLAFTIGTVFMRRTWRGGRDHFVDPYRHVMNKPVQAPSNQSNGEGSIMTKLFSGPFLPWFLVLPFALMSAGSPAAQQSSPILLHSVRVTDIVAALLTAAAAFIHATGPQTSIDLSELPFYPQGTSADYATNATSLLVGGIGNVPMLQVEPMQPPSSPTLKTKTLSSIRPGGMAPASNLKTMSANMV